MGSKKPTLLLAVGWAMLIGGVLLMLDACIRVGLNSLTCAGLQSTVGFTVVTIGWLLRRCAVAQTRGTDKRTG